MDQFDFAAIEDWLLKQRGYLSRYAKHINDERDMHEVPSGMYNLYRYQTALMREYIDLQLVQLQELKEKT